MHHWRLERCRHCQSGELVDSRAHSVKEKLEARASVADVGCGKGASTLLMAKVFPESRFFGFDYHDKSIEAARDSAKREGVADRVAFEVAQAKEYPGKDYDFIVVFDCLRDMGDPVGAAAQRNADHARSNKPMEHQVATAIHS
jgi:ubiquinone/menaquinone biosynthesis C-methylase UbiE